MRCQWKRNKSKLSLLKTNLNLDLGRHLKKVIIMKKSSGKMMLSALIILGCLLSPLWLRKPPIKDWAIVFLFSGFLSGMLDLFLTSKNMVSYPIRLDGTKKTKKRMKISFLFDYSLLPTLGVFYGQLTFKSKLWEILGKAFYFSIPLTIIEFLLERHTKLIKWKNWTWYYTLGSVTLLLWLQRAVIGGIRRFSSFQKDHSTELPITEKPFPK